MPAPENKIKAALETGAVQKGIWLVTGAPLLAEMAGRAGFDWCLVDGEHAPFDPAAIRSQLIALEAAGTPSVVRVPTNEDWVFKQVLDLGVQTVLAPMVNTAEDAAKVVRACRYPPEGIRGMGGGTMRAGGFSTIPDYPATANAQICVMAQAETREAMANLEEIAKVDGVDCVFFGPSDLAADMGYRDDLAAPEVWNEVARGIRTVRAAGKAAGVFAVTDEQIAQCLEAGANFVSVAADAALFAQALRVKAAQ